jgi:heat shock protein HtpX
MAKTMFQEIRSNVFRSYLLVFFFFIFVGIVGTIIGLVWTGDWITGIILSFIIGFVYTIIVFSQGKTMVLKLANAKLVTKREFPHLFHAVEGLAVAAGMKVKPEVYVIPDKAMNAFATGYKPEKSAIAVTTGLLETLNREELEGVIAHEMSHIKNLDIRVMMLAAVLVGVISLLSHIFLRSLWFRNNDRDNKIGMIMMIVGIVLAIFSPLIANMIKLAVSRKREYLADATGASLTRYPPGLANALEKIKGDSNKLKHASNATAHLFISNPIKKQLFSSLFSTHPPIDERIKRLRSM